MSRMHTFAFLRVTVMSVQHGIVGAVVGELVGDAESAVGGSVMHVNEALKPPMFPSKFMSMLVLVPETP